MADSKECLTLTPGTPSPSCGTQAPLPASWAHGGTLGPVGMTRRGEAVTD